METVVECTESSRARRLEIPSDQARRDSNESGRHPRALSKTIVAQVTVGSNPTPSANRIRRQGRDVSIRPCLHTARSFLRAATGGEQAHPGELEAGRCFVSADSFSEAATNLLRGTFATPPNVIDVIRSAMATPNN